MKVTANARRSGDWWAIEVPEVAGVHTQVRRLDQAPAMVRDAVSLMTDVPEDSIEVEVVPEVDEEVSNAIAQAAFMREEAEVMAREATDVIVGVARALTDAGLSLRDAGAVLGISHQRVAQLLNPAPVKVRSTLGPAKSHSRAARKAAHALREAKGRAKGGNSRMVIKQDGKYVKITSGGTGSAAANRAERTK